MTQLFGKYIIKEIDKNDISDYMFLYNTFLVQKNNIKTYFCYTLKLLYFLTLLMMSTYILLNLENQFSILILKI